MPGGKDHPGRSAFANHAYSTWKTTAPTDFLPRTRAFKQSFLLWRLPPYFRNVGKRLVKAPKLYLRGTGLLHHLLNIDSLDVLESHPIWGGNWETFVLEDLLRREAVAHPHS